MLGGETEAIAERLERGLDRGLGPGERRCGPRWPPWPGRTAPWPAGDLEVAVLAAGNGRGLPPAGRRRAGAPAGLNGPSRGGPSGRFAAERAAHGTVKVRGQADLRPGERVRGHLHAARPATSEPRRGGPLPVPPGGQLGRSSNVFLENGARLYLDVGSHPEYATPECDSHRRAGGPRQGGGVDPLVAGGGGRGPSPRGGHPGRHLPVQEQHRLGRQLLRLPRELPDQPARRLRPLHRGAHPLPGQPPGLRRCRQGAPDGPGRGVLPQPAGRAHLGGRVVGHHPEPARSSTPGTSPTPTPSGTAGSTSSWATPT